MLLFLNPIFRWREIPFLEILFRWREIPVLENLFSLGEIPVLEPLLSLGGLIAEQLINDFFGAPTNRTGICHVREPLPAGEGTTITISS